MRNLKLSLEGLSLTLTANRVTSYDRKPTANPQITHSVVGTAIVRGTLHEPKQVWTVSALLTEAELYTLKKLEARSDRKRRSRTSGVSVTVEDGFKKVVEDAPRTRALATGATETIEDGSTEYFATWKAYVTQVDDPRGADGKYWKVTFNLVETETTSA